MTGYVIGVLGMWLLCDGIISIKMYPKQSWKHDHSIRLIRIAIAIYLIIAGASV